MPSTCIKLRFLKKCELDWSNLPSKFKSWAGKFFSRIWGRIPAGEGEIFWHFSLFLPFSFSPQITEYQSIKDFCISTGYICLIYVPIFTDINLVKEDIIFSFLWRLWKWKENGTNKFDLPNGHLNPGFLNKFPPMIWILREIRSMKLTEIKISRL